MKISESEVKEIQSYMYDTVSLNVPISSEDDTEWGSFIQDINLTPEETFIKRSEGDLLNILITNTQLTSIEENVIRLRYNFVSHETKSIDWVAKRLGIHKTKVLRTEKKALKKLRITAIRKFGKDFFI